MNEQLEFDFMSSGVYVSDLMQHPEIKKFFRNEFDVAFLRQLAETVHGKPKKILLATAKKLEQENIDELARSTRDN